MAIEDYRVSSYNGDNRLAIDEDGVITLEVVGKTGFIFEQSIERIQELHDWTARVLEAAQDPLMLKRNRFAQELYSDKYDNQPDHYKDLIDRLIDIEG